MIKGVSQSIPYVPDAVEALELQLTQHLLHTLPMARTVPQLWENFQQYHLELRPLELRLDKRKQTFRPLLDKFFLEWMLHDYHPGVQNLAPVQTTRCFCLVQHCLV